MRKINFYKSRGQLYAKVPASSYREDKKVKKRNDGIYLGRVIGKSKNVFYSSDRGLFTYDPVNNVFKQPTKHTLQIFLMTNVNVLKFALTLVIHISFMNSFSPAVMTV